jgi:hypothetical protein
VSLAFIRSNSALTRFRYFGQKKVVLKHKLVGRDTTDGRELVSMDEIGSIQYRHLSRSSLRISPVIVSSLTCNSVQKFPEDRAFRILHTT